MKTRNTTDCALGQRGLRVACAHNCGRDVCTRNNLKQQCTNTAHCVHTYDNPRLQSRKRCLVPSPDVSLSLRLHPRCPCSQSAPDPFPPELRPTSAPPARQHVHSEHLKLHSELRSQLSRVHGLGLVFEPSAPARRLPQTSGKPSATPYMYAAGAVVEVVVVVAVRGCLILKTRCGRASSASQALWLRKVRR